MSHLIDQTKGKPAFVSYQESAWHGLGKTFKRNIKRSDLENGVLDFTVEKSPNIHRIFDENGKIISETISDNSFFTYRTDNNIVLGSRLGSTYEVFQNKDLMDIAEEILKLKKCNIETAASIDEGRKVFILFKMNSAIKVSEKDFIETYFLLTNGHDGSLSITALPTNVRVVCNNTLGSALYGGQKKGYRIRHTINAEQRVKEALEVMGLLEKNNKQNENAFKSMYNLEISTKDFYDYIGNVFFNDKEISALQSGSRDAISSTRRRNEVEQVLSFAEGGIGQDVALKNGKMNMWFAYNAVTGYLTGKKYKNAEDRFESLLIGQSANKIIKAGDFAMAPHQIKNLSSVKQNFNLN